MVAALRATGVMPSDVRPLIQAQITLGEPLWRPPAPKGFDDGNAAWTDGLAQRLDIANQLAPRVGRNTADRGARGKPSAGAGAIVDVAGIPTEMTMNFHAPTRRELLMASGV